MDKQIKEIRIIAPSASAKTFFKKPKYEVMYGKAVETLSQMGFNVSFSKNAFELMRMTHHL